MPEGDAIHRVAAALRTALVGRPITRFDALQLDGPRPAPGRVVERIENQGKHLHIIWDDGLVLHTNLRRSGAWHLYRAGERWRRPTHEMRVSIAVHDWVAVCYGAPVVETYREFDRHRHPGSGPLGPDVCASNADLDECINRLYHYQPGETPVAEVMLDQHVMSGVGNVYRSEVLWSCEIHPFAPVRTLDEIDCAQLVNASARLLRANLQQAGRITVPASEGGVATYGRNGQRCRRCGDTIEVRRTGEAGRLLYWCPGCQLHRDPTPIAPVRPEIERSMDRHPAAEKFLSDLPWRKEATG